MSVCLSVTASHFHNSWPIWMKLGPHNLNQNLRWHFSQIFKIIIWWRHIGRFVCLCVCVYVCVSVRMKSFHNFRPILMKMHTNDLNKNLRWPFFHFFKILFLWRHNGYFICFPMGHSHGRNFKAIFFKLTTCLLLRMALYGIANQRSTSSSSGQNDGWKNR